VEYLPAVGRASAGAADVAAAYERALAAAAGEDRRRRTTTVGPHRDDLALAVAGLNGRHFASEGQQRTAALALRVAQFRLLEKSYGETPLMLLDDVGSELDERRRARLAELLGEFGQTWLSGAVVPAAIRADAILRVSGGKISS
jgi:DNA replication and repair protein RecF